MILTIMSLLVNAIAAGISVAEGSYGWTITFVIFFLVNIIILRSQLRG